MNTAVKEKAQHRDQTIYDIERQTSGPVWVLNNTEGPQRGSVTFQVSLMNGVGYDTLSVPASWLPIDLLQKVGSRQQLVNSAQFKRCLDATITGSGRPMLRVISDEEAQELLMSPGAEEELAELRKKDHIAYAVQNRNVQVVHHHEGQKAADQKAAEVAEAAGPTPRVVQLMDGLVNNRSSEMSVLNSLRSMGSVTNADAKYILEKADRSQTALINWAKSKVKA